MELLTETQDRKILLVIETATELKMGFILITNIAADYSNIAIIVAATAYFIFHRWINLQSTHTTFLLLINTNK